MSTPYIQPYLFFGGRCEEALDYYRTHLGAKVEFLMRFKDSPEAPPPGLVPPGFENKVMHTTFHIGASTLMAADGCKEGASFNGFMLSLVAPTESEAHRCFDALADGGKVRMPLAKTFWSPCFGTVEDRFGLGWMVSVVASAN